VKLRLAGTANRLNIGHRTSNIERRILMALRFIESKTSESQPATSPSVASSGFKDSGSNDSLRQAQGLSLSKAAESILQGGHVSKDGFAPGLRSPFVRRSRLAQPFFKLTEYIIRCWTFNVRCSFFSYHLILNYIAKVTFSIKMAPFQPSGEAGLRNLIFKFRWLAIFRV
jgi:hypothetical protein